jgi:lipopolysaccharide/colanic/teichoic acid biosynthesis glycosyltransferase
MKRTQLMEARSFTDMHSLEHPHRGESTVASATRRALDVVVAMLLLTLAAPMVLVIAVVIRLDSRGPVLFRQRRIGRSMRPFVVVKFRTMRRDADDTQHREYVHALISAGHHDPCKGGGDLYKLAGDERVTRVGRFLRRFSLDEVPQLWNVVRGEMSLVGPRPVIPYEVEQYPVWYHERFVVKPGLTGLWQVSGRSEKTYEDMVRLDIEYARTRRVSLDLAILLKTLWVVVRARGAA